MNSPEGVVALAGVSPTVDWANKGRLLVDAISSTRILSLMMISYCYDFWPGPKVLVKYRLFKSPSVPVSLSDFSNYSSFGCERVVVGSFAESPFFSV